MKYNIETLQLLTDEGEFIKGLDCPINKHWENLVPHYDSYLKRRCGECCKDVIDISAFNEQQVKAIIEIDPESCFHIRSDAPFIEFVGEKQPERRELCMLQDGKRSDCRIIRTARNLGEINSYFTEDNYHVIAKVVEENPEIQSKIEIMQNPETGKVELNGDYRGMVNPGSEFWYHPRKFTSPVAAYIVPDDMQTGERVYIPDLIEEYVGERWNQGDTYKLESAFALWNGEDFEIEVHDVCEIIG